MSIEYSHNKHIKMFNVRAMAEIGVVMIREAKPKEMSFKLELER